MPLVRNKYSPGAGVAILDLLTYFLDNRKHLQRLCKPFTKQFRKALKNDPQFSDEIIEQYESQCKKIFADEATKSLACDAESVMMVLEEFDVEGFLE